MDVGWGPPAYPPRTGSGDLVKVKHLSKLDKNNNTLSKPDQQSN